MFCIRRQSYTPDNVNMFTVPIYNIIHTYCYKYMDKRDTMTRKHLNPFRFINNNIMKSIYTGILLPSMMHMVCM
jgi:hypothetical protein